MARENFRKIKLLKLLEMLRQSTDEQHPMSTSSIIASLAIMNRNEESAKAFIRNISAKHTADNRSGDVFFRDVSAEDVATLVNSFRTLEWHYYFDSASLADGIRLIDDRWNVCIKNGPKDATLHWDVQLADGTIRQINAQKRKSSRSQNESGKYPIVKISGSKVKVGAGGCTSVGLENISMQEIKDEWAKLPDDLKLKKDGSGIKEIPDEFILHYLEHPLLLIHFLHVTDEAENEADMFNDAECKVIALSLAFPSNQSYEESKRNKSKQQKIKVYLNTIAQQLDDEEGDDVVYEDL